MAKPKRPKDTNQRAKFIVDLITGDEEEVKKDKEKVLSTKGVKGGLKGGKARAKKLPAKKRKEIAKKAAAKRWSNG